jgi:hypothetical protein
MTRILITIVFVVYRGTSFPNGSCLPDQSPSWQCLQSRFTATCHTISVSHFLGTIIRQNWQFAVKWCPTCFFNFYVAEIYAPRAQISVEIRIYIRLNPDLFLTDPNPWQNYGSSQYELESELGQNSPDLRTWFYIYGCPPLRALALKRPIFKRKKGSRTLVLACFSTPRPELKPSARGTIPNDDEYFV